MRILVVDDDRSVRDSLRRSLQYNGYTVEMASDGAEALARVPDVQPDLIIMDVMMPRLGGLDAAIAGRQRCVDEQCRHRLAGAEVLQQRTVGGADVYTHVARTQRHDGDTQCGQ